MESGCKYVTSLALMLLPFLCGVPDVCAAEANGIKHSVEASIISEPKITSGPLTSLHATLTLLVRISAHSKSADFSGEIPILFENFSPNDGVPFRKIWEEDKCHERRGLPKIWIEHLTGSVRQGDTTTTIDAVARHIGVVLPEDELKTQQQVEISGESTQSVRLLEARSIKSHYLIQIRLISSPCQI